MSTGYVFQIFKHITDGTCGTKKVPIGPPVTVEACSAEKAQCLAACEKLKEPHYIGKNCGYHPWLVAISEGRKTKISVWMPYEWFYTVGKFTG